MIRQRPQDRRQVRRAAAGFNQITAANAGLRLQFRFADYVLWPGVAEF